jgi:SAM-dependent methyltransferase
VLDVGTGTGLVALEAAGGVGPTGRVVGVDVSAGMLAEARAAAASVPWVSFRPMPAEALDLAAESFDAVLSLFAIAHVADAAAAVREMHRVLRPGGRLVIGQGAAAPLVSMAGLAARVRRLPLVVARQRGRCLIAPQDLERLLADAGPAPPAAPHVSSARLTRLVREAAFQDVRTSWVGDEGVIDSPEEFWDLASAFSTPARTWLAAAGPSAREAVRARFLEACRRVRDRGGRLVHPQGAWLVIARRGGCAG